MSDTEEISRCIEAVCQLGCDSVRSVITELEAGRPVAATARLDAGQRRRVLAELKAIMAVYDRD